MDSTDQQSNGLCSVDLLGFFVVIPEFNVED